MSGQAVTMQGTGEWGRLDGRDNALNFVRLLLATVVLLKHSWNATHGAPGPLPYIASFAVDCFFAISGYLIAGSRSRLTLGVFAWRRALRILPGLWLALGLTALVFAPAAAHLTGRAMDWHAAATYVLNNGALVMTQWNIGDTLAGNPLQSWNTSAWTLPYEALAYAVFGLTLTLRRFGRRCSTAVCAFLGMLTLICWMPGSPLEAAAGTIKLLSFFAAGVALWFWRDRLPHSGRLAAGCAVSVAVLMLWSLPMYTMLAPAPVAFTLLWLGAHLPVRVGAVNDISFGLYVQAFPVTQLLIVLGLPAALGDVGFAFAVLACTLPLAAASWLLVERPAMRLRRTSAELRDVPDGVRLRRVVVARCGAADSPQLRV